jgi:hypothetical protein
MRKAIAIASATLLGIAAAGAQTVTDTTPPPPPPPVAAPQFDVELAPDQAGAAYLAVLPVLGLREGIVPLKSLEVDVERDAAGAARKGVVTITAELSPEQLAAVRNYFAPRWPLPPGAKARPLSRVEIAVTNSGAAKVTLRYR